MMVTTDERISEIVDYYLEYETFQDFLERFDLTPQKVTLALYEIGLIGEDDIDELRPS